MTVLVIVVSSLGYWEKLLGIPFRQNQAPNDSQVIRTEANGPRAVRDHASCLRDYRLRRRGITLRFRVGALRPSFLLATPNDLSMRARYVEKPHFSSLRFRPQIFIYSNDLLPLLMISPFPVPDGKPRFFLLSQVSLPYPVEESKGRAKFDKVRRRLEVTLPVVRPPMPPRKVRFRATWKQTAQYYHSTAGCQSHVNS
jgi:hypothetical protein